MSAKLIKCKTCNSAVSSNAQACPGCGEKLKASGIVRALGWCFAVMVGFAVLGAIVGENTPPPTPEQAAAANKADERFRLAVASTKVVREAMRNPDSFVLEHAYASGKDKAVACLEYRAQNGFGGMTRDRVIVIHNPPELLQDDDSSKFAARWGAECFAEAREVTAEVRAYL